MSRTRTILIRSWWLLAAALVMLVTACAGPKRQAPLSELDTPRHHYVQGMQAVARSDPHTAAAKFQRALALDPEYAPALAAKAMVLAIEARQAADDAREKTAKKVRALLDRAEDAAADDAERFGVHVTAIRALFVLQPPGWIEAARKHYEAALDLDEVDPAGLPYYQGRDAADYFMGVATYRFDFRQAEPYFRRVLAARANGPWQRLAERYYRKLQKITRVSANRMLAAETLRIAIKDTVNRGDVAALLVDELHLDSLFAGRLGVSAPPGATAPPTDITDHPFAPEITTILRWNLRGLEPEYDRTSNSWRFHPGRPVTRKEFALLLEDILIKVSGDPSIATAMLGAERSPFPDVPPQAAWFNAAMTVTSRGLMETGLTGEFRPDAPVDGAELLAAVFELRRLLDAG